MPVEKTDDANSPLRSNME